MSDPKQSLDAILDQMDAAQVRKQEAESAQQKLEAKRQAKFTEACAEQITAAVVAFQQQVEPRGHKVRKTDGAEYTSSEGRTTPAYLEVRIVPKELIGTDAETDRHNQRLPQARFMLDKRAGKVDVNCWFQSRSGGGQGGPHKSWSLDEVSQDKVFGILVELLQRYIGK